MLESLWAAATALVSTTAAFIALQSWRVAPDVPVNYVLDGLLNAIPVKSMLESGGYLRIAALGAPDGSQLYDFPFVEPGHMAVMRLISMLGTGVGGTINAYYLLGFALAGLTGYVALRWLDVSRPLSLAGGATFALLPYHFLRGARHLYLSAYYAVPLVLAVSVWLLREHPPFIHKRGDGVGLSFGARDVPAFISCALVALTSTYYAFFAAFIFGIAGMASAAWSRRWRPVVSAGLLVAIIVGVSVAWMYPSLAYRIREGANPIVAHREPYEAEIFGLQATQMLLPMTEHRVEALASLKARYKEVLRRYTGILDNENDSASLGLIGLAGAVVLGWALVRMPRSDDLANDRTLRLLALQAFGSFALGTVGGLGALLAFLAWPQIRGYNRISVFVSFACIAAVVMLLDRFAATRGDSKNALRIAAALLIMGVAFFDQTSSGLVPDYATAARRFDDDAVFVGQLEDALPDGAALFQLPAVPFPESAPVNEMTDYEHARMYLHSTTLRWSYGAVKGRDSFERLSEIADMSAEDLVREIEALGFAGVVIDRRGYGDAADSKVHAIEAASGGETIVSPDGDRVFVGLR